MATGCPSGLQSVWQTTLLGPTPRMASLVTTNNGGANSKLSQRSQLWSRFDLTVNRDRLADVLYANAEDPSRIPKSVGWEKIGAAVSLLPFSAAAVPTHLITSHPIASTFDSKLLKPNSVHINIPDPLLATLQ